MPTLTFSLRDLNNLIGKNLSLEEIGEFAFSAKGSFEGYAYDKDELKIDFGDTNLPYLWSVEGFARFIKGMIWVNGLSRIRVNKSNYKIKVDNSVKNVRAFISSFVAKDKQITDYMLKQFISLQEKLSDNYGRKREKLAIGLYPANKIKFPITYKAVEPESVSFVPLESHSPMNLKEILENHPKGKEYARLLTNKKDYPILIDAKHDILSFPPIINSEHTGKLNINDSELFFEATGTDINAVLLATNIFAQALYERGFKISSVNISYDDRALVTPIINYETKKLDKNLIKGLLGIELNETEIKKLLAMVGYNYQKGKVVIPHYRADIMHTVDIIEDIAIAYGYNNIQDANLSKYTIGSTHPIIDFIDKIREMILGLGYNEIFSPVLTNKEILYKKMNLHDFGTVEIEYFMSETYSVVRTWLIPILLECLSKNKHVEQPHKIFEQGIVVVRDKGQITESENIALLVSHEKADFTVAKQILDYLMQGLSIEYKIDSYEHPSFISGRCLAVIFRNKIIGYMGEIHPSVLTHFSIETPVSGFELNLSELFN